MAPWRVVEPSVVICPPTPQVVVQQARQLLQRLFLRQRQRTPQAQPAGQEIVATQPDCIERLLPPAIIAYNETHVFHQMRRITPQATTLVQGLDYHRHIALLQIAHPAVNQLRTSARSGFSKVVLFDQQNAIPPTRRIDCHAQPGSSASYHQQIPWSLFLGHLFYQALTFHFLIFQFLISYQPSRFYFLFVIQRK